MPGRWIACSVTALVALPSCSPDQAGRRAQEPPPAASATTPPERGRAQARRCNDRVPFEPTYLPRGFERELLRGAAARGRPADSKNQVIRHFRGSGNRAIEIRRPGTFFSELAQADDAPTIEVLGTATAGFAPIEPYGDEFIVQFEFPPSSRARDRCALFSLNEYGVSLAGLKKVAEGLREIE